MLQKLGSQLKIRYLKFYFMVDLIHFYIALQVSSMYSQFALVFQHSNGPVNEAFNKIFNGYSLFSDLSCYK